jgi:hypothetical protein
MKGNVENYVILYDCSNVSVSNFDLAMIKEFLKLGDYYPERLKYIFVLKPSWYFSWIVSIVRRIADEKTMSKVVNIYDFKELNKYIDPSQIQKEFGGESDYKYIIPK